MDTWDRRGGTCFRFVDINQAQPGVYNNSAEQNATRPFYSAFPGFTFINEIQSIGNSNYNSLQATLRVSDIHGFTSQFAYTWSHAFDEVTSYRGALPQNSRNFHGDYGSSDFDSRHNFVGLALLQRSGNRKMASAQQGMAAEQLAHFP